MTITPFVSTGAIAVNMRLMRRDDVSTGPAVGAEGMGLDAIGAAVDFGFVFAVEAFVAGVPDDFVAVAIIGAFIVWVGDAFGAVEAVVRVRARFNVIVVLVGWHGIMCRKD